MSLSCADPLSLDRVLMSPVDIAQRIPAHAAEQQRARHAPTDARGQGPKPIEAAMRFSQLLSLIGVLGSIRDHEPLAEQSLREARPHQIQSRRVPR